MGFGGKGCDMGVQKFCPAGMLGRLMDMPGSISEPVPPTRHAPAAGRPVPTWVVAAALALVTLGLYWPATRAAFINYDDPDYVTQNPRVPGGLNLDNLQWAFTHTVNANWHPVTMLSHMLDGQLFGLQPWGPHLVNVLWHTANTVLVFLWLRRLTGARWRSALVAALFGWHPAHVESVAWVAERKDVPCLFFGLLTLVFYTRYAMAGDRRQEAGDRRQEAEGGRQEADGGRRTAEEGSPKSKVWYGACLAAFALGLLSKPMLVTWPLVLLLLDYWPLGRFQPGRVWPLVREKLPFFALVAASSVVTFLVQRHSGAGGHHVLSAPGGARRERGDFLLPLPGEAVLAGASGHLLSAPRILAGGVGAAGGRCSWPV